jgi:hypothetical protein
MKLPFDVQVLLERCLDECAPGVPLSVEVHTNGVGGWKVKKVVEFKPKDLQRPGMAEY